MKTMTRTATRRRRTFFAALVSLLSAAVLFAAPVLAEVDLNAEYDTESNNWEDWPEGPSLWGQTACLMDVETGKVMFAKGANAERYPASITKVMTAIIVLENCGLDDIVTMTETGLADAYWESSNINPVLGEQFTVQQCLEMLLVKSANDVATQLAEFTSGSVEAFAEAMNEKAASLGCQNTHFANASGLEDENHYTSAYDMCLIMREALTHDTITDIWAMPYVEIPATEFSEPRLYESHVYLMQQDNPYYYEYCFGGKTGYTDISLSTLVCAAEKDGVVLVGAVMGAPDTGTNAEDMVDLFNYGYTYRDEMNLTGEKTKETPEETEEESGGSDGQLPEDAQETESTEETVSATKTPVPEETPVAVTTSEPKAEITGTPVQQKVKSSAKTIIYIIIICVLLVILIAVILLELRARNIRNQRRKKR